MSIQTENNIESNIENNAENNPLTDSSWADLTRASLGLSIVALGLCGFVYSAIATGLGQVLFPEQANGSLIVKNNQIVGSYLVAQPFTQEKYFHLRPSASLYDPMAVAGSNLAHTNPNLHEQIQERISQIAVREQVDPVAIPADLLTASGSGIDPEISVQAAMIQVKRIAAARQIDAQVLVKLVEQYTIQPTFAILGQQRVNVLVLNSVLDAMPT